MDVQVLQCLVFTAGGLAVSFQVPSTSHPAQPAAGRLVLRVSRESPGFTDYCSVALPADNKPSIAMKSPALMIRLIADEILNL